MQSRLQEILSNISELDEAEDDDSVAEPPKCEEEEEEYEDGDIVEMMRNTGLESDSESDNEDDI